MPLYSCLTVCRTFPDQFMKININSTGESAVLVNICSVVFIPSADIMSNEEQFCLKWSEFEKNIRNGFKDLKNEGEFFDVTLACEGRQVQAHKVDTQFFFQNLSSACFSGSLKCL